MNVSIIIPNYNGESILKKNLPKVLESAENYSGGLAEILISDDGSVDNSVKIIKEFIDKNKNSNVKISLLQSSSNMGFSSNVNRGSDAAKYEILVLLNTDVSPHRNFLMPLVQNFEDGNVFAVGCMDESIEGGKVVLRGRGVGKWRKGFLVHKRGEVNKRNTLWAGGGSGAFRKNIWDRLGGMDPIYNPFYWDDIDLSYRALKSGYQVVFEKDSIVRHEHEKGAIKSKYPEQKVKRIAYRNQFIFVWKNSDISTLISHILWLPYNLLLTILRLDFNFIWGFLHALRLSPKILKSRRKTFSNFVKSDSEILNNIK